jgi:hypothetical protein
MAAQFLQCITISLLCAQRLIVRSSLQDTSSQMDRRAHR